MPSLRRHSDRGGCYGHSCEIFLYSPKPEGGYTYELLEGVTRPTVGYQVKVIGLSMWWQCSPVEEILEDTPDEVRFRTRSGQIYTWKP